MKDFTHLHLHTEYSLLDGAARIAALFPRLKKLGMSACAVTDHGNMYGVLAFAKAAKEHGIKPIFGSEFYTVADHTVKNSPDNRHLILLAKTQEGYKNLVKLSSISFIDGFYYRPRIDIKTIREHSKGLICLSACLAGDLQQRLLNDDYAGAKKSAENFAQIFGGDFYIELQDQGLREQAVVNPQLINIARECGIPVAATNDVHYVERSDAELQDVLMCISMAKRIDDPTRLKLANDMFYLKSRAEMEERFAYVPEALDNTVKIADMCEADAVTKHKLIPGFTPPDGTTPKAFLRKLTEEGLKKRYKEITPEIAARAEYELGVIDKTGFNEYFLIVYDFIAHAESKGITVGPGRGSGVGSIVAYATGITKVDPLKYGLLFERFLNPERVSTPDFDIDFCFERRDEVIDYVLDKYGADKVAQIITFGTLAAKAAVKDVGRVMNVPYADVDRVTKLMPYGKIKLKDVFGLGGRKEAAERSEDEEEGEENTRSLFIQELRNVYDADPAIKKTVDLAAKIEGVPRNTSTHAAGVVICSETVSDFVPLQRNGGDITTQFTKDEVEKAGLLKMDFLGLRTLTDIKKAKEYIAARHGKKIDFYNMEYDDKQVFKMISAGDTDGVFQLESPGMKRFMKDLQPTAMEDIIAGISLYRPGPMQFIESYARLKRDPKTVTYLTPELIPILAPTFGIIVYQEQVMQIFRTMGGFSLAEADVVRRAVSKKDAKLLMEQKALFVNGKTDKDGNVLIEGALRRGFKKNVAEKVFEHIRTFANYGFNKSHAAAYAYLSYQTAYLKKHYFTEFMAATLNNRIDNIDEITKVITYCVSRGTGVLPPDLNKSGLEFAVEGGSLRFGLVAIKGVGQATAEKILEARKKGGAFKNIADFFRRVDSVDSRALNKKVVEALVFSGAADCFGATRAALLSVYENLFDTVAEDVKRRESGQVSFFEVLPEADTEFKTPDMPEMDIRMKMAREKETLGVYVTGHPLQEYRARLESYGFNTSMLGAQSEDEGEGGAGYFTEDTAVTAGGLLTKVKRITTRQNQTMAVCRLEDLYGGVELVLYPRRYERLCGALVEDAFVEVSGTLSVSGSPRIICENLRVVTPSENGAEEYAAEETEQFESVKTRLCLKIADKKTWEAVYEILEEYPGATSVAVSVDGQKFKAPCTVRYCNALRHELLSIINGEENIVFEQR